MEGAGDKLKRAEDGLPTKYNLELSFNRKVLLVNQISLSLAISFIAWWTWKRGQTAFSLISRLRAISKAAAILIDFTAPNPFISRNLCRG